MRSRRHAKFLGLTMLAAVSLMAVSATAAQAKYLLLLNGKSVSSMTFGLEFLTVYAKAENGLKIQCSGGEGSSKAWLAEGGKKLLGSPSGTFTGCVWVGQEKTCTINDEGIGNLKLIGNDEMSMFGANEYVLIGGNAELGTIYTEGVFCTIPEEEVLGGTASATILDALTDTKVKLADFAPVNVKIGNSKVTEIKGEMHVRDLDNLTATFGIHLVELP
jgi:hypothetical protein